MDNSTSPNTTAQAGIIGIPEDAAAVDAPLGIGADADDENASQTTNSDTTGDDQQEKAKPKSQRDLLVDLVLDMGCELFRDATDRTYISIPVGNHVENIALRSNLVRRFLQHSWRTRTGSGLSGSIVIEAIDQLDARAYFAGAVETVYTRIAHTADAVYVDLGTAAWTAARITANGWEVITSPPVKLVRSRGMLPLPEPKRGGDLSKLRRYINATTDDIWVPIAAWLIAAFSPGPYPVLVLLGEQGSAKSFVTRLLRRCIDPSEVEVTTTPKDARDIIIAAQNSFVVALDNLSGVSPWLSDLLCSVSTGAAYRERKYHTNDGDEVLFKAKRPVALNGIDFAMRDDLLSRALVVSLAVIPDHERRDEKTILAELEADMPEIVGGLFDVVASVLKTLPSTTLKEKPRMADFALWSTAAESAMGWRSGHFMQIYSENRNQGIELALESDSFGTALVSFMSGLKQWEGGWHELLDQANREVNGDERAPRDWPKSPKALSIRLKRLAPALRHVGINFDHSGRMGNRRIYKLWIDVADVADVAQPNAAADFGHTTSTT